MSKRQAVSGEIEEKVLYLSGRRCCFCYGLNGDFTLKRGQIAHLDRDSSNSSLENLAYLCLYHHDEYDSRTSQSKRLTIREAKKYRKQLHDAVGQMRDNVSVSSKVVKTDFDRRVLSPREEKSTPPKVWLPSVLVIGHRFDADIQGDIQCVLWDEEEPNLAEYDIVIVDLTLKRKPLLPAYRPRVWKDPEFNISHYLTWTHTRNRIEKLILSGGSIIVIVDSADVYHIDAPSKLTGDIRQKLLPFVIYGEQTPVGTSVKLVDPKFECYFRNFDGWNFTLNRAFDLEFEYSESYRVRKVIPIAMNKANEMLAISVEVGNSKSEDSGWIHILPKPIRKTSFDAVKSLVSNIDNFIQHLSV